MTIQQIANGILLAAIGALAGTFIMISISQAASAKPVPWPPRSCNAGASCKPSKKGGPLKACPSGQVCSGMPVFRCYPRGCPMPI